VNYEVNRRAYRLCGENAAVQFLDRRASLDTGYKSDLMIDGIFRLELRNTFSIASIAQRQRAQDYCSRSHKRSHS